MATLSVHHREHSVRLYDASAQDVLFAVAVPKNTDADTEVVRGQFTKYLSDFPRHLHRQVFGDTGGVSAAPFEHVQLFKTDGLVAALVSHTLDVAEIALAFTSERDSHRDSPRDRAVALKLMLRDLSEHHVFSLAIVDGSSRIFAASTSHSAPLAFGHTDDGTVIVTCTHRRRKSPRVFAGATLTHLPSGRFLYGHAFLRPVEFTSFWGSAETSRAGTRIQYYQEQAEGVNAVRPKGFVEVTPTKRMSMDEALTWRWGAQDKACDQADSWRRPLVVSHNTNDDEAAVAEPPQAAPPPPAAAAYESSLYSPAPPAAPATPAAPAPAAPSPAVPAQLAALVMMTFMRGAVLAKHISFNNATRSRVYPSKKFLLTLLLAQGSLTARPPRVVWEDPVTSARAGLRLNLQRQGTAAGAVAKRHRVLVLRKRAAERAAPPPTTTQKMAPRVPVAATMMRGLGSSAIACSINGTCCFGGTCFV